MNLIGRTIANRYEIIEKTGVGGMATVYKAKDILLNRYVAVKVLKEEFTTDQEFVSRFNTEALAAASLSHANIVSIYDVGNEDNVYYIVMELVRGKTLKQIITEEGALSWKWGVDIATQIASALEVAHKNNIIHRDIKPHNIIITEDGVAKVTDFGIAKAVSNSTITAFGTTIGSVHYFSPEQAKGGYTDAKSDLYSLGVVMYEMLTGKVPFDADTSVSVALKHMQEEPVPPMEVNEEIPKAVNDIILKAMQKEPMARYQSASEMIADLKLSLKDPDGDFVENEELDEELTKRMDAITDDMLDEKKNKKKKKNAIALFFEKHPKAKVPAIILSAIVLFILVYGITTLVSNVANPKEVQIPNLTNLTEDEAQAELNKIHVKYKKVAEQYSTEVEAGRIISQDPPYMDNYMIKEKTTINVVVSKGTESTIVPKVTGMTVEEAVKALEDAKLTVEKVEESSKKVEAGIVISQDTPAKTSANAGDTVKIHVSTGTDQIEVPSVIGETEENAKSAIEEKGLKAEVSYSADTSKDNGVVVSQSINGGKKADEGSTIKIVVNKYSEIKHLKVKVNLSNLVANTEDDSDKNSNTTTKTDTSVTVQVNSETRTNVSRTKSDFSVDLTGKDGESKTISVAIFDANGKQLYSSEKDATFGKQDSVTFD